MNNSALCPLDTAIRVIGDRWSLLILRDMMLDDRRCFRELSRQSREGIATNILTARLKRMVAEGLLTPATEADPQGRRPYAMTERGIALLPIIVGLMDWGLGPRPDSDDIRARLLVGGGAKLLQALQEELRAEHIDGQTDQTAIRDRLRMAAQKVRDGMGPLEPPLSPALASGTVDDPDAHTDCLSTAA